MNDVFFSISRSSKPIHVKCPRYSFYTGKVLPHPMYFTNRGTVTRRKKRTFPEVSGKWHQGETQIMNIAPDPCKGTSEAKCEQKNPTQYMWWCKFGNRKEKGLVYFKLQDPFKPQQQYYDPETARDKIEDRRRKCDLGMGEVPNSDYIQVSMHQPLRQARRERDSVREELQEALITIRMERNVRKCAKTLFVTFTAWPSTPLTN